MKPIIPKVFSLPFVLAISGCVAGQSLQTTYTPSAAAATAGAKSAVQVVVTDDRPYVKNGDKPPHYIGKYRAGFGNPWERLHRERRAARARALARDLSAELGSLGYAVKSGAPIDRTLTLSIKELELRRATRTERCGTNSRPRSTMGQARLSRPKRWAMKPRSRERSGWEPRAASRRKCPSSTLGGSHESRTRESRYFCSAGWSVQLDGNTPREGLSVDDDRIRRSLAR